MLILKSGFESPGFVSFGANLTHSGAKPDLPGLVLGLVIASNYSNLLVVMTLYGMQASNNMGATSALNILSALPGPLWGLIRTSIFLAGGGTQLSKSTQILHTEMSIKWSTTTREKSCVKNNTIIK